MIPPRLPTCTGDRMLACAPILAALSYTSLKGFFRKVFAAGLKDHNQPNVFTNLGPIAPETVDFGIAAREAWLLTPPIYPPFFGAGVSGYAGMLTLSAGAPAGALPFIEGFLDCVIAELPG